ncbi:uncharacterized protein LOC125263417 [Megalobrama amblycephala]|uniref:uncharacterized protein LOC125263417 n=1 Tax=Megalobrama amblycephala TaxID=75352 RepID=UPI002013DBC0|nr:uncharacterized protein LOC125263417 [Megalobrama amblycephala]
MAAGQTDLASLGFLNQTARMRSWHNSLNQAKIAEPTVHHYLKNVAQFLAYLAEIPPPTCRLSRTVMVGLNREIKMMIRSVRRKVVMHEVRVKQAKEGRIIPKATLRQCVASAKTTIPDILAHLRETADRALQWSFYGHLTTYLACIYGHRGGVFQNMTIAEMEAAKTGSKEGCFVINAKNSHTPGDRQKVAQFMCHDISTADRFYALNLDAKQVAEHCRLFEAAVEGEDAAPGSPKAWKKTGKRAGKSSGKWPAPAGSPPASSSPSPPGSPSRLHRPRGAKSALRGRGDFLGLTSPP